MKNKGKKYAFKTEESYPPKSEYCHYSGLPSPSAYGRVPIMNEKIKKQIKMERYATIGLALIALVYSVCLGLAGMTEEAQYSANWPATILLFTIAINQVRGMKK